MPRNKTVPPASSQAEPAEPEPTEAEPAEEEEPPASSQAEPPRSSSSSQAEEAAENGEPADAAPGPAPPTTTAEAAAAGESKKGGRKSKATAYKSQHGIAVRHRKKSQAPGPLRPSEVKHFLRRSGIRRSQASSLRANATKLLDEVVYDLTRRCVAYADSQKRKKIVLADVDRSYRLVEGRCLAGIEDAFDHRGHQDKGRPSRQRAAAADDGDDDGASRPAKRKSPKDKLADDGDNAERPAKRKSPKTV